MQQHTDGLSMVVREEPTNVHVLYSVGVWGRVCGGSVWCVERGDNGPCRVPWSRAVVGRHQDAELVIWMSSREFTGVVLGT